MVDLFKVNNVNINFKEIELEINKRVNEGGKRFDDYDNDIQDFEIEKIEVSDNLVNHCNIKIPREITSHRPVIGNTLIKIRQILDDEIRRSLDPMVNRQIEINMNIVNRLNKIERITEENEIRTKGLNKTLDRVERITEENEIRTKRLEKVFDEIINQTNSNIKEIFKLNRKLKEKKWKLAR
ncbi:hypothetical protein HYX17_01885 [Candidatus Woesearchaeota archaeon]|nr:hypothetical protein [Candidatus Woesearchaeota archaeon]